MARKLRTAVAAALLLPLVIGMALLTAARTPWRPGPRCSCSSTTAVARQARSSTATGGTSWRRRTGAGTPVIIWTCHGGDTRSGA
ncbi:hypothetical protein [Actinophytocola algeriensis]|uniref:Spy/CpxP family protein refolding chaperone n=1 Tax=Actinophytocola algeriensis TaxID=1768010 RepID=A0A7W7QFD1_9PSEU|nr:hypothetical protein [Actinophytocola algeriensis]MBB4912319.1 Spy/CpxP family protein refolding chaperone [Actinophytocola algeriensis]MBE1474165.1 Spy/CpxP family protein refolding chaperone [Actinophytocola algeriensis]